MFVLCRDIRPSALFCRRPYTFELKLSGVKLLAVPALFVFEREAPSTRTDRYCCRQILRLRAKSTVICDDPCTKSPFPLELTTFCPPPPRRTLTHPSLVLALLPLRSDSSAHLRCIFRGVFFRVCSNWAGLFRAFIGGRSARWKDAARFYFFSNPSEEVRQKHADTHDNETGFLGILSCFFFTSRHVSFSFISSIFVFLRSPLFSFTMCCPCSRRLIFFKHLFSTTGSSRQCKK